MTASELKGQLATYLAVRSALGYRDYGLHNLLEDFVRYIIASHPDDPIRARIAVDWACTTSSHNGASRVALPLSAARGFLTHVRASFPTQKFPRPDC
jgi:hypothetical protein